MSKKTPSSSNCLFKQPFIPILLVVCAGVISFTIHLQTEKLIEQQLVQQRSDKKLARLSNDTKNIQSQIVDLRRSIYEVQIILHREIKHTQEQLRDIEASNQQILSITNEVTPKHLIIDDEKVSVRVGPDEVQKTSFGGIGVVLRYLGDGFKIEKILDSSPAQKAGLYSGDIIIEIESQPISEMTKEEALSALRGPKGSKVQITIEPSGALHQTVRYNLIRDIINISEEKAD